MTVPKWAAKSPIITSMVFILVFIGIASTAASQISGYRWWVNIEEFDDREAIVDAKFEQMQASIKRGNRAVDSKLEKLQSRITTVKVRQINLNIDVLQGQLYIVEREIRSYLKDGKGVPNSLYRERGRLKARIMKLELQVKPNPTLP